MSSTTPLPAAGAPLDAVARDRLADLFAEITVLAGAIVMAVYGAGCEARSKADASPVTEADERAEALILARLATACRAGRCWPRKPRPAARPSRPAPASFSSTRSTARASS